MIMSQKRILVTGASGCIGHYITEALIQETEHELYLLVRNPDKLQLDAQVRPGIHILQGDMREIKRFAKLLKTVDSAVLIATAWGGAEAFDINVVKTLQLLDLLDPDRCQQVIYFSTASILDRNSQLLKEAGELGTDYIRSKYDCFRRLLKSAIAPQITILFPTLVFGGDADKPYSHVSAGLPEVVGWINLIRWLKADGSFHFIHARDIAQLVRYLLEHPPEGDEPRQFVLGQKPLTVNAAIEEICAYLGKRIYFRLPVSLPLANLLIFLFRMQMAAWDRFSMRYRHFTYQTAINPSSLELPNYCATLSDVLKVTGISPANATRKQE